MSGWPWWRRFRLRLLPQHLQAGLWGEGIAERHLRRQGYKVLGRRVRVGPKDEIDLVMRQGETLIFVEVKTRASELWGRPVTSVDRGKRKRIGRAAMRYMKQLPRKPPTFRFDVVEVIGEEGQPPAEVRHLQNVFGLPTGYRVPW